MTTGSDHVARVPAAACQTKPFVYGPGGYRFFDFARVGVPLQILPAIVCVLLIPLIWPFTG
ncbi:MAG: hypothetical protein HKP01_13220 [Gemmatimonadetes bacterium]|nr:hypothetical protein [Gemmatimonadota bacterium]